MKRSIVFITIIITILISITPVFAGVGIAETLRPYYNGTIVLHYNNNPIWIDNPILNREGRTYMALRDLEKITDDIELQYNSLTQNVYLFITRSTYWNGYIVGTEDITYIFTVGTALVQIYKEPFEQIGKDAYSVVIDAPPFIENNRVYVPIRFIAEELGWNIYYYKGDLYIFDKSNEGIDEEIKLNVEMKKVEKEQKIRSVQRNKYTPYDLYGVVLQKYDRVACGGFYGTIYNLDGDMAYIYWDSYNMFVNPNNIELYKTLAGINYGGYQWIETKYLIFVSRYKGE